MNNPLRIGLFGFGRIGRNIFRLGHKDPRYNFIAISDLGDVEAMHYLLVRDSIHGSMNNEITLEGNYLKYDDHSARLLAGGTP
jgi:glyceraldehyde 3-phosphate dehydrogenase